MNSHPRSAFGLLLPTFGSIRRELEQACDRLNQSNNCLGALTVWQDAKHLEVEVDGPGFAQTDLELRLEEGKLWIRGERKPPREGFAYNDRPAGKFERAVLLPETIDPGSIDATLAEGVLQVRLSKKPEAQPQPTPIKVRPEVAQPLPPAVS